MCAQGALFTLTLLSAGCWHNHATTGLGQKAGLRRPYVFSNLRSLGSQLRPNVTCSFWQCAKLRTKSLAPGRFSGKRGQLISIMARRDQSRVSNATGKAGARDCSEPTAGQIDEEVRKLLNDAYQLATATLMADRDKLESIAKALLQYEALDGSQLEEIIEHGRLTSPAPGRAPPSAKNMRVENPLGLLGLTPREVEVLTWVAQGKTNYEIGVILSACTRTICKHVERILTKLCVENRTAAAAIAIAALAGAKHERCGAMVRPTSGEISPRLFNRGLCG
jgi:DNA-binding NarL/FixJ family response regulator